MCQMALANHELLIPKHRNCNANTDAPFPGRYRPWTCSQYENLLAGTATFAAIERGLEDGEFCPERFHYVFVARDPIDRMDSFASLYTTTLRTALDVDSPDSGATFASSLIAACANKPACASAFTVI